MTITTLATWTLARLAMLPMQIDIDPNGSGLPGIDQLRTIVGAVMTVGLILSVLALIVSAIVWGFGSNSSNPHLAGRGKIGVLISCGAAVICGAADQFLLGRRPGRLNPPICVREVCDGAVRCSRHLHGLRLRR